MIYGVQRGELAQRLRNYFGVVGGVAPELRSEVSAVAVGAELTRPPYRTPQDERSFYTQASAPAVAAQLSYGMLHADQVAVPPLTRNGFVRVERVRVSSATAGIVVLYWLSDNLFNVGALATCSDSPFGPGLTITRDVPVRPEASAFAAVPGTWVPIGAQHLQANGSVLWDWEMGWYPEGQVERGIAAVHLTVNTQIYVEFAGAWLPNAIPQR